MCALILLDDEVEVSTLTAKAKANDTHRAKPKRRVGDPRNLVVIGRSGRYSDDNHLPRRRNPAKPRKTANDVMLDAWEYTYNTRRGRLTKP